MKTKFLILFAAIFIAQLYLASSLAITSVTSNPREVQPGGRLTLNLEIENDLGEDIENVVVNLDLEPKVNAATGQIIFQPPFAPYQSSNEDTISEISDEDSKDANFDLIVFSDAVSGTYNIPVRVSYTETSSGNRENDVSLGTVSIIVNAKPKIEISSEGSALIKGTKGTITIKAVNSGLGNAKFLSVSLNPVSGIQLTGQNKVYIGNIDSNDFDTADFSIFVNANAPSTISLPVQLTYTDSQNNQVTENKVIPIKTYTAKEAAELGLVNRNSTFLIIVILIIAVIVFFVYRSARKRRRIKRSGQ